MTLEEMKLRRDLLNKEWRQLDSEIEQTESALRLPSLTKKFTGKYFKIPNQPLRNLEPGEDRDDETFRYCRIDMVQSIWAAYGFVFHLNDNEELTIRSHGHITIGTLEDEGVQISEYEFLEELQNTLNVIHRLAANPKQEVLI